MTERSEGRPGAPSPADRPMTGPGGAAHEPAPAPVDFDEFFAAEHAALVRVAWALTGRLDVAEEIVQESFLSAYSQWTRVSSLERPGAWMRRVVTNRCVSSARRRFTELRLLTRLSARRSAMVDMAVPADELWAAVRALPKRQAQVLALVYAEDRAISDVAAILGCSEPTARTHLRRGRLALARALGTDNDEVNEP
jgi:RNA polymerase sigma-70 factor (ECF subfamily)